MTPLALPIIDKILDAVGNFFPSEKEKAAAKLALLQLEFDREKLFVESETELLKGQIDVNKVEAASDSRFTSNWRPFVGWTCASSLLYSAVVEPVARFVAMVVYGYSGTFPVIDSTITLQILMGLLGLAGMRSFDKVKGTVR